MAEENGAPAVEAQNQDPAAAAAAPKVEAPKQEDAAGKTYTQAEVEAMIEKRVGRIKAETIEKAASELAAEALAEVTQVKQTLAAAQLEAQIATLSAQGANADLLRKTGLTGADLDGFAADLITATGAKPGAPSVAAAAPGSASAEATVAAFINKTIGKQTAADGATEDWQSGLLAKMRGVTE